MLSLGYSILYKNVIGAVERHGLNPYFGFMHQDAPGHATLVSDIVETWRTPIVDDTVLQLLASGTVTPMMFHTDNQTGGVYGTRDATRVITTAFGDKVVRSAPYLKQDSKRYTFQYALDLQLDSLVRAIENRSPSLYTPIASIDDNRPEP